MLNSGLPLDEQLPFVRSELGTADHVVVALDFDGTLAPIAEHPEDAHVSPEMADVLQRLAATNGISVAIVSGRSIADLKRKLNLDLIYAGNHGLEIEGGGISFVHQRADWLKTVVDHACWSLEANLESVRGARVERKGLSATVHFRQAPPDLSGWIEATVRATTDLYAPALWVRPAREAWEILPRTAWTKGSVLHLLMKQARAARPVLICAGDDLTDEDMFSVSGAISIKVSAGRPTRARYMVPGPAELLRFLNWLHATASVPRRVSSAPRRAALPCAG